MNREDQISRMAYELIMTGKSLDTVYLDDCEKIAAIIYDMGCRIQTEVVKNALLELKKQVHDRAVYTNSQDIPNYVNLKVFDAILQNYLNSLK